MKKEKKTKQWVLRLSFATCLIVLAVLIETIGMHPTGIYSYTNEGYKDFQIGLSKKGVLRQINLQKTMRAIQTCRPVAVLKKTSRKKLKMNDNLDSSDIWVSYDRTGKQFLFFFKGANLKRILIQRLRFGKKKGSALFLDCTAARIKDIDHYLKTQEKLNVFLGDGKRIGKRQMLK
ncbi:MAG: hypothetical protein L3J69_10235 [Desulfobacula sp.]|nr:hypothetical protein [Desulfobacula sp.]